MEQRQFACAGSCSVSCVWVLLEVCCLVFACIGCRDDGLSKVDNAILTTANRDDGEMAFIPAGEFIMGNEDEKTAHLIYLDAYYIDKYLVTNARYRKFTEATGHRAPKYCNHPRFNQPNQPVIGIHLDDADAYAKWAGKRLPTEAEWEKAARGGLIGKKYPWGDAQPDRTRANFDGNEGGTSPVGKYLPNGFGLYDMAGNVFNWCADGYHWDSYRNSPKDNPKVPPKTGAYCVVRGGSWRRFEYYLRCSSRYDVYWESWSYADVGFRCAKSASQLSPR